MKWIHKLSNLLNKYFWHIMGVLLLLAIIQDSLNRGLDWSNWAEPGSRAITLWGRALWDWAGLLLIPLVLAIGGFLLQRNERKTDREIAKEAGLDKTLDEYLKAMTSLLLQENSLFKSKKDDPIRDVARTQTIIDIKRLDFERNKIVFQFLQEANLISTMKGDQTEEAEKPIISLAWADLSGADLNRADLSGADLRKANIKRAKLREADLQETDLQEADLREADLRWADLRWANLQETDLQEADLQWANLRCADLQSAFLLRANLTWTHLREANLEEANLSFAVLRRAKMQGAKMQEANLQEADLEKADLQGALLQEASLQGALLQEADLRKANLQKANLQGVNLQEASLQGANLQGAIFSDISSILREGSFKGTTMPDGTIFSESTNLKKFTEPTGGE